MNDVTKCTVLACLSLWGLIQQAHPYAAMGASFGCVALLLMNDPSTDSWFEKAVRKIASIILSWGAGYAAGLGISNGEWADSTMIFSVVVAAFASSIFGGVNLMFRNSGPLPPWLSAILDRLPFLRKGNDGSQ